jgi:hypothetical protein
LVLELLAIQFLYFLFQKHLIMHKGGMINGDI